MLTQPNLLLRLTGILVFAAGFLPGALLAVGAVWADMEAALFDASLSAEAPLSTLRCPVLMTSGEPAVVTASITNPGPRDVQLLVRTHIGQRSLILMREVETKLVLAPGETRRLEWTVSADERVYGRLVLIKVHSLRSTPLPYRQGSCGILVVDVPSVSPGMALALTLMISVIGMGLGLGLWVAGSRPLAGRARDATYVLGVLAAIVGAGVLSGLTGWWGAGVLILMLAVLLLAVMFELVARRA